MGLLLILLLFAQSPEQDSFYFRALRAGGISIDEMTPTVLSPLREEDVPRSCPERMVVCTSKEGYARWVRPFLDALRPVAFEAGEGGGVRREACRRIERAFAELDGAALGEVKRPVVRVLFKHYPRDLPGGRAVTLHATIYSVPDLFFDAKLVEATNAVRQGDEPRPVPGALLDVRKTWLLGKAGPRLVEASIEATTEVRNFPRGPRLGALLEDASVRHLAQDEVSMAHFEMYAGDRAGLAWFDRACEGPPDPLAIAYAIPFSGDGKATLEREPLDAALVKRVLEICARA